MCDLRSILLAVSLLVAAGCSLEISADRPVDSSHAAEGEHEELAPYMGLMQRYSQKLGYAIRAGNGELAGFYVHELEETAESLIDEVPVHDGLPIARTTETMLMPKLERMERALAGDDRQETAAAYEAVIGGCNACHTATEHDFIVIEPARGEPPFNQRF